ncbi:hypothetical protein PJ267_05265 [Arthrobacter sp. OVS8]|nr:hypothetical protein PJ267_05265 [Arthrobacter sp. OVS8]
MTGALPSRGGDSVYLPRAGPGGFAKFFQPRTGPRPEHQAFHLDLTVPWGSRQTEVERLVSLGATFQWDVLDEFPTCSGPPLPIWRGTSSVWPNTRLQTNRVVDPTRARHRSTVPIPLSGILQTTGSHTQVASRTSTIPGQACGGRHRSRDKTPHRRVRRKPHRTVMPAIRTLPQKPLSQPRDLPRSHRDRRRRRPTRTR